MHELFYQIEINCKYHNKVLLKKGSEGKRKKNCINLTSKQFQIEVEIKTKKDFQ